MLIEQSLSGLLHQSYSQQHRQCGGAAGITAVVASLLDKIVD